MGWRDLFRRGPKRFKMEPYRAPEINPDQPLREHVIDDGVMVARYSARLTLKNRIIVGALRGEDAFDTARYEGVARRSSTSTSPSSTGRPSACTRCGARRSACPGARSTSTTTDRATCTTSSTARRSTRRSRRGCG
ncbi:hypothetical protein [Agromyces mangrovi Wang et al. 2018]|uniref:hypothetical protein n=1 Tax=Agromyces mangrovi TaxID=1858653 RepID=UPI0025734E29|nr:hypothetical protein [Agromyces mangrovi]BDZ64177.1 hypothetical protein GCM10025877_11150 [Agromyces mangrovi]